MIFTKIRKMIKKAQENQGFTMIELLMVIVVIGILAGIGIPAYQGMRTRAQDAELDSTARNVMTALELYSVDNNGNYPGSDAWITNISSYVGGLDESLLYSLDNTDGRIIYSNTSNDYTLTVDYHTDGKANRVFSE